MWAGDEQTQHTCVNSWLLQQQSISNHRKDVADHEEGQQSHANGDKDDPDNPYENGAGFWHVGDVAGSHGSSSFF